MATSWRILTRLAWRKQYGGHCERIRMRLFQGVGNVVHCCWLIQNDGFDGRVPFFLLLLLWKDSIWAKSNGPFDSLIGSLLLLPVQRRKIILKETGKGMKIRGVAGGVLLLFGFLPAILPAVSGPCGFFQPLAFIKPASNQSIYALRTRQTS